MSSKNKIDKEKTILDESHFMRGKLHGKESTLDKYCNLVLGYVSISALIKYELITLLFGYIPGAAGFALRKIFYRLLFDEIGSNVVFGRSMIIRCAKNIKIGNDVVFDDYSIIDGRGAGDDPIEIGDHVVINRGAFVHSKLGTIKIGPNSTIGAGTGLVAQGGGVHLGQWVSLAGGVELSCGMFEHRDITEDNPTPFTRFTRGDICVGDFTVVAFGAIVLDGISVGQRCMVGAGCLVMEDLPDDTVISARPGIMLRKK